MASPYCQEILKGHLLVYTPQHVMTHMKIALYIVD